MTTEEKWLKEENRGQRWRRLTPLGILTSVSTNFVGWGIIVWFLCYFVQNNDKKFDLQHEEYISLAQEVKEIKDGSEKNALCLTRSIYQCCGEKANVSC